MLWSVLILVATTVPLPSGRLPSSDLPLDKIAHFALYLGLGWTVGRSLVLSGARSTGARLAAWAGALLFAAADEVHQALVPSRVTSLADWFADAAGATLGLLIVTMWMVGRASEEGGGRGEG